MAENITLLLLGLGAGSLIALSALGLVLMYRSSGVVNFATGGIGMSCSFVLWDLTRNAGWSALPAGVVAVVVGAALGVVTYVLVMVLPRGGSNLTRVIATLAVLIILESVAQLHYGPDPLAVGQFLPSGSVDFGGGIAIPASRLILLGAAVILALVLGAVYTRTMFGLATTAVSERPRTLAALGWRISWIGALNWGVGGALCGLAGVLLAPIIGVSVANGTSLTVTVLAAALIGGLRSFPLTIVGGMVIGMLQSLFGIHDLGIPGLADAVPFLAIIGVIAIRGRGLPLRSFVGERLPRVGSGQIRLGWVVVAVAVVVVLVGWVLNDNGTAALTTSLLAAIPLLSLTDPARVRGPDVPGSGHPVGRGQPDRGPAGGKRRTPVPARGGAGHAGHGPGRSHRGAALCSNAWHQPRRGHPRARRGDPGADLHQPLHRRRAGRHPAPQQRILRDPRIGLRQLPACRSLRLSGAGVRARSRACSWPISGRSGSGRRMIAVRGNERAAAGLGRQRRHDEAVGVRDRGRDHRPGRGSGRLQCADRDLHELLGPGQPDRGRLQRRGRGGQRRGRPVRQYAGAGGHRERGA